MRFFDFISVKLTFFLILGILIGYHFTLRISMLIPALLVCLAVLAVLVWNGKGKKRVMGTFFGWTTLLSTTLLGMLAIAFSLPKNQPYHYLKYSTATKDRLKLKIVQVLKPNAHSHRYYAEIQTVDNTLTSGKLIVYQSKAPTITPLGVDDEILTYSIVRPIPAPLNPHQFDFKDYLKKLGVTGQLRISGNQFVKLEKNTTTLVGIASQFREDLINGLQGHGFGKEQLAVVQALLLGQRNDISDGTYTNYKNAGAVHILAVSGLHVGILLFLFQFLLRPLERFPNGKTIKLILMVALLWGYAFVAGLSPSIVRAVTMFSFLAYALYLNRPGNTFNILALSLFFILLAQPLFLFHVGFQMSYAAVFAIVWIYPKLQGLWRPKSWLAKNVWQLGSVSVAAQLGVVPISLFHFHQFPALFFVSNLVVVPFLGIILCLGLFVLGLAYVNWIPSFLVSLYDWLIGAMNRIIAWVAQQENFLFTDIPFDGIQLVLGYVLILSLVVVSSKCNVKNLVFFLSALVVFSGYLVIVTWVGQSKERLWLLHQTKNTIVLHQNGNRLRILAHDTTSARKPIKPLEMGQRTTSTIYGSLKNHYTFRGNKLLVVDSTGIYGVLEKPDYVLLSQSPKIHLDRFLQSVRPKMVLADGSNYKSYVARWKQTCRKRKLPFHYTGEKGAYLFSRGD